LAGVIVLAFGSFVTAEAQEVAPQALTFSVLHDFAGAPNDGAGPAAAVTPAGDGSYYGTTSWGGNGSSCDSNCGVVFKLAPDGSETVLYNFAGGANGSYPINVIPDEQGNLYGITVYGGDMDCDSGFGCGVVFELTPDGTETVLHTFSGDDESPSGPLIRDADGNLYGTTYSGDINVCSEEHHCGTVFKLAPDGTYTRLHNFVGGAGGVAPNGVLIRDRAGNLYGEALNGGFNNHGVIFKLKPDGTYIVLYAFMGGADGWLPEGGLVGDQDGNFYGTTYSGGLAVCGKNSNCGTVFKLAPNGTHTVLYTFKGGSDGVHPQSALYRSPQTSALYGTTLSGGKKGCNTSCGTVFVVRPDGSEQVLHRFDGNDGANPIANLVKGQGSQLIGTTWFGGANNDGVIYSLQMTE